MKKIAVLAGLALMSIGLVIAGNQSKAKKGTVKKTRTVAVSKPAPKEPVLQPGTAYRADKDISEVIWQGRKVTGTHYGKLKLEDGTLIIADGKILRGNAVIDMNSMTCGDIKDPQSNADLINHLKATDFFHTEIFRHAILDITSTKSLGENKIKVIGTLTIKGQSKPISFDARIESLDASSILAKGKIVFDRTKYDIKYGSTLFGAAADKAIEDNVVLDVTLFAKSAQ